MKKKILEFLQKDKSNVWEILDVKLKDTDDDDGLIGEHYIVKCVLRVPDTSIPMANMFGRIERTCLVNISQFNSWLREKESIKWL